MIFAHLSKSDVPHPAGFARIQIAGIPLPPFLQPSLGEASHMTLQRTSGDNLAAEVLLELYSKMLAIRMAEDQLAQDCAAGKLPGPVHLYVGQEAVAVGVCAHLQDTDWIASTHRGHGHYLAKGGELSGMIAEVYGRAGGVCGGYGGSMHVADFGKGIMGANGIVGGGISLMVGAALAAQLDIETEKVTSEVPSPVAGQLTEFIAEAGLEIEVGDPVCRIRT